MTVRAEPELIDNFIRELEPHLVLIDQAVAELQRPAPDALVVSQAVQSLTLIRSASSIMGFNGLVRLTQALDETIVSLQDSLNLDPEPLHDRTRTIATGLHRYVRALASGHDTDELVTHILAPPWEIIDEPEYDLEVEDGPITIDLPMDTTRVDDRDDDIDGMDDAGELDPELRAIFEEEAAELIASFTPHALTLVRMPGSQPVLHGLRRDAHTLKGAANMTGFPLIGQVGGSIEALLDAHVERAIPAGREATELILIARRLLASMLSRLDELEIFTEAVGLLIVRAQGIAASIAPVAPAAGRPWESHIDDAIVEPVVLSPDVDRPEHLGVDAQHGYSDDACDLDTGSHAGTSAEFSGIPAPVFEETHEDPDDAVDSLDVTTACLESEDGGCDTKPFDVAESAVVDGLTARDVTAIADDDVVSDAWSNVSEMDDRPADGDDEPDLYELASEIATLARLRTTLEPHNAMIVPDALGSLTDDIDARTAELIGEHVSSRGTDTAEVVGSATIPVGDPEEVELIDHSTPLAYEGADTDGAPAFVDELPSGLSGQALLDLAFGQPVSPHVPPAMDVATALPDADIDLRDEMLGTFAIEAADYVEGLTLAAMVLERDAGDEQAILEIARLLHTLKGAAGTVGFDDIGDHCHAIEDELTRLSIDGVRPDGRFILQLLELVTATERAIHARPSATGGTSATNTLVAMPSGASRGSGDVRVDMRRLDGLLNLVGEMVVNRSTLDQRLGRLGTSLDELGRMTDRLRRSGQSLERYASETATLGILSQGTAWESGTRVSGSQREFDALEMDRYTALDLLARELAEIASDIGAAAGELRHLRGDFDAVSAQQRRLTNTIQDELMGARMMPLSSLAPALYRIVRHASRDRDKEIDLVVEGGDTPFDSSLLEALGDALLHLLRNAVDHGIEDVVVRGAAGKPVRGRVLVRAYHDRNAAVIEVIDDGRGIDADALVERARTFGLIEDAPLTRSDALDLIFLPGFTTRDAADALSGRGVGLDAVRAAVERLKGQVHVESRPGTGTTFQLRFPVMLTVAQAFLVTAGGQQYAVPLGDIDFVADRKQGTLTRIAGVPLLELNDTVMPAIDLAAKLDETEDRLDELSGWLLIIRTAGEPRAIRVDALQGQQEIVVKPLGRFLGATPGITGATVLGDGEVALILDIAGLLGTSSRVTRSMLPEIEQDVSTPEAVVPVVQSLRAPRVLVVDDSLSVRRVLARTLQRHGWDARQAHDGVEALEMIHTGEAIDIVITDIEMPRMDGFDLIASIRRDPRTPHLPLVVLTSRSSSKHRDKALDLGADAYLVKPFQEQELVSTLQRALRPNPVGAQS